MSRMIFVNLPVSDLQRSIGFCEAVGARREPAFSTDQNAMMAFSETINIMLLTHSRFRDFMDREIADAQVSCQVLVAMSVDSRADVDATIDKAVAAGGRADPGPVQDHGFMYGRSCADPDGHIFEFFWMDVGAATQA